jgi:hypothetical protein
MPTPSLILVPARFKTGKLYTPVATTSGGVVLGASGDFNVTRATTATRVNASGLIESVASGIPRLDYYTSGGTAGCPALLVEPSAQNTCLQSQDFTTTWSVINTTRTANQATSPDNTLTADRISITSNGGYIRQVIATSNSTTYTASCFVKNDTVASGDTFRFYFNNNTASPNAAQAIAIININAGTVTTSSGGGGISAISTGIENYGNGWYRVRVTFTLGASAGSASSEIGFDAPTATRTFFAWGAQFETGSAATSYIPTTAGTGSRSADVISVTGAVSGSIGQTEGTIYAEVDYRNLGAAVSIITLQTASFVSGAVRIDTNTSNQVRVQIMDASGTSRLDATFTQTALSTGINKLAVGYSSDASGIVFALNGSIIATTQVSASFGTLGANRVYLGTRETSATNDLFFNNRIRAAALYTTRLTNAELATLTTP